MALKMQQKVYGEGHMKVATSYHNLNIIYRLFTAKQSKK